MPQEVKEKYAVTLDGVSLDVEVRQVNKELRYHIFLPRFEEPTKALMDTLRDRLSVEFGKNTMQVSDYQMLKKMRNQFSESISSWISEELPLVDEEARKNIIVSVLNSSLGIGNLEFLLKDDLLEEVAVNSSSEVVRVYHKRYGWLPTNIKLDSDQEIQTYAKSIARQIGKEVSISQPLLDAHLRSGDRVNAVLDTIADKGTALTIRLFSRDPWTFPDLIENKTLTPDLLALMWLMVQNEMNIIISGGTGSGKTVLMNVLMPFIQPNHRIISIEDTRELQLPEYLYWVPLKTRVKNPEGTGEISMSDLLINALRMRPDRMVLGEIRRGEDAEILFEAMHTGHSVYATLHADSAQQTVRRLTNPPISIPSSMLAAIHLNVVMHRDRQKGVCRICQVAEIIPSESSDEVTVTPNILYKWKPRTDEIVRESEDIRLFQELSTRSGLSKDEIMVEIDRKKRIIDWFVKNKVRKLGDISKVMRAYYLDEKDVWDVVEKNQGPKKLLDSND